MVIIRYQIAERYSSPLRQSAVFQHYFVEHYYFFSFQHKLFLFSAQAARGVLATVKERKTVTHFQIVDKAVI